MGIDPVTATIIGGVVGGASLLQASQQNKALKRSAESEKASNDIAARERREITAKELQRLEGTLRSSSAGRGIAGSATTNALSTSATATALDQQTSIELNNLFANQAADARAAAQFSNPLLSGLSGFSSGIQLGGQLGELYGQ